VRFRKRIKLTRRPLGKQRIVPPIDPGHTRAPSVEQYEKRQALLEAKKRQQVLEKQPKPIPCWRTHVSLLVDGNKRDIWALLSQWDKKELWHPSFVTESAEDMPSTNWIHDKQRVVRNIETGETFTEGLCEELPLSRHITFDIADSPALPFEDYVCTLKVTAWGDHKSVVDWVSNYTLDVEGKQTEMNERAHEVHNLLARMALGVRFVSGEGTPLNMRLRAATTQELYGGFQPVTDYDVAPAFIHQTMID
jgi:hypothetical protein